MNAEEAIEIVTNAIQTGSLTAERDRALAVVQKTVEKVITGEVAPVVHGEWIDGSEMPKPKRGKSKYKDDKQYCSNCCREMFHWKAVIYPSKYCPNCGAKMDRR